VRPENYNGLNGTGLNVGLDGTDTRKGSTGFNGLDGTDTRKGSTGFNGTDTRGS